MASTFTTNTGIEKIGDGEQTGQWGQTTNVNFDIVDRALNGVLPIQLFSTAFTLTTSSGGLSDGQAAAVIFTGSIGGPATITIAPDTAQKTYVIHNDSNQPITITQGSGGDVTIPVGSATVVACTGGGATSRVFEAGISQVNLATGVTGTLPVANGGTGTTSTQFTNLTTNVTGTLPVANGGTGRSTITSGAIVLGNGTGQVGQLVGTSVGQVAQWNGSTWAVESLPAGGVTNVTASAPLASSGGSTPNLSLTGTVAVGNGGTGSTTASGAMNTLGATRSITTGTGLLGGGTLGANRTFSIDIASQAEAEAGTDNAHVMTPLRVKQSVVANTLAATAGAAAGAIGTYVFASGLTGQNAFGTIVAGSILRPVALRTTGGTGNFEFANYSGGSNSDTLSGTFRQMGGFHTISTAQITLFLRIS